MSESRRARSRSSEDAPPGYRPSDFPQFAVTVDAVVLTIVDRRLHVLLVQRGQAPYKGRWALPGGFKRPDETLDEAVARELAEETALAEVSPSLVQLGAYGDPDRDPRMPVVTVAYLAVVPRIGPVEGGTDAAKAEVVDVDEVRDGRRPLAFDHDRLLRDALARAEDDVTRGDLAYGFLGETFTMLELRTVHEAVRGVELDPANFRRTVLAQGDLEPAGAQRRPGPDGGKPAELFRTVARRDMLGAAPISHA